MKRAEDEVHPVDYALGLPRSKERLGDLEHPCFGAEELCILSEYGEVLGTGDMKAQIKNSELAIKRFRARIEETEAELKKKERIFRALGVLGGAAAALLVI